MMQLGGMLHWCIGPRANESKTLMERVLAPWFAAAADCAPQWRRHVHGGLGHRVEDSERPTVDISRVGSPQQAHKLRDALELFALAKELDATAFVTAVCRQPRWSTASSKPWGAQEKLRVKLELEIGKQTSDTIAGLEFVQSFLGVQAATASRDEFNQAKQRLLDTWGGAANSLEAGFSPQFELELELRLLYSLRGFKLLPQITKTLEDLNRAVFNVAHLTVVVGAANYGEDNMTAFFQTVHSFRGSANVDVQLQLPGRYESHEMLYEWKPVFDLVARKQFGTGLASVDSEQKQYNVAVKCRGTDDGGTNPGDVLSYLFGNGQTPDFTDTWLASGCVSAVANAGSHVTSVALKAFLEDDGDTSRFVRAKWLGYLARAGFVEKLTITEKFLTMEDVDAMTEVYTAATKSERYRLLFNPDWHEVEDEGNLEDDEAEEFLSDPSEVLGLMHDIDEDREHTDALLVGYGQAKIESQFYSMLRAADATSRATPERDPGLKSLHFRLFGGGDETVVSMTRFAALVGDTLEELVIEIEQVRLPLVAFLFILDHCPRLRRLEMKGLALEAHDDMLRFDGASNGPYALEALSVDLLVDEASTGLLGFCGAIKRFSPGLKELVIRGTPGVAATPAICNAMDAVIRQSLRRLERLHVASFPMEYFRVLLEGDASGLTKLQSLVIEDAVWEPRVWRDVTATLALSSHPITRSLLTLGVSIGDAAICSPEHLTSMLYANHLVRDVRLVLPTRGVETSQIREEVMKVHGAGLHRRKSPLQLRRKLALLSSLDSSGWQWESQSVSKVFEFGAVTETRNVAISFKK